jgi:hypothetical protein
MTVAKQKHNPSDVGLTTSHWQSLLDTVQLDPRQQSTRKPTNYYRTITILHGIPDCTHTHQSLPPTHTGDSYNLGPFNSLGVGHPYNHDTHTLWVRNGGWGNRKIVGITTSELVAKNRTPNACPFPNWLVLALNSISSRELTNLLSTQRKSTSSHHGTVATT